MPLDTDGKPPFTEQAFERIHNTYNRRLFLWFRKRVRYADVAEELTVNNRDNHHAGLSRSGDTSDGACASPGFSRRNLLSGSGKCHRRTSVVRSLEDIAKDLEGELDSPALGGGLTSP
jgi:hypothetical protein